MTIHPITDTTPACYGVACEVHHRCARYAAVDGMAAHHTAIACCSVDSRRPLFIEIKVVA